MSTSCAARTLELRVNLREGAPAAGDSEVPSPVTAGSASPQQPELRKVRLGPVLTPAQPAGEFPLCGSPPGPARPPGPQGFTWVRLRRRLGLPGRCAGPRARLVLLLACTAAPRLGLWLRALPLRPLVPGQRRGPGLPAAGAVPQDVLDEEGGERLGLGGLPGPRLRSPEHPVDWASWLRRLSSGPGGGARGCRPTFTFRHPRALITLGRAPRRLPIGHGDLGRAAHWPPVAPGEGVERGSPLLGLDPLFPRGFLPKFLPLSPGWPPPPHIVVPGWE